MLVEAKRGPASRAKCILIGTRRRVRELRLIKETVTAQVQLLTVLVDFTF